MAERAAGGCHLHGCPSCGGVWLSAQDSARLAERFPLEAVQLAEAAAKATARVATDDVLLCPSCRHPLVRSRFRATAAGFTSVAEGDRPRATELVELDVCAQDGTFFDAGELPRAARAIHVPRNNGPGQYLTLDPDPRTEAYDAAAFESDALGAGIEFFGLALSLALSSSDDD